MLSHRTVGPWKSIKWVECSHLQGVVRSRHCKACPAGPQHGGWGCARGNALCGPTCVADHSGSPAAALPGLCALSGPCVACDLSAVESVANKRCKNRLHHLKEAGGGEGGMGLKCQA